MNDYVNKHSIMIGVYKCNVTIKKLCLLFYTVAVTDCKKRRWNLMETDRRISYAHSWSQHKGGEMGCRSMNERSMKLRPDDVGPKGHFFSIPVQEACWEGPSSIKISPSFEPRVVRHDLNSAWFVKGHQPPTSFKNRLRCYFKYGRMMNFPSCSQHR